MTADEVYDRWIADRPKKRGDCVNGERPCPWVACKHHLYLDVNPDTNSIKIAHPNKEPWELDETCALDIADRGGVTLEEVGLAINVSRERARQIESKAVERISKAKLWGEWYEL